MLISSREATETLGAFLLFCEGEQADRRFVKKSTRNWFTIFFVRVLARGPADIYHECDSCGHRYRHSLPPPVMSLGYTTDTAIRHVVVAILRVGERVRPLQRKAALVVAKRFGNDSYGDDDLSHDLKFIDRSQVRPRVAELALRLSHEDQKSVLTAAVYLAGADTAPSDAELRCAVDIGWALGLTRSQIRSTIDHEVARRETPSANRLES